MNPDDQSLYADMRAAIQGDRERAERRRAQEKRSDPVPAPPPERDDPPRRTGLRRLFGGRRATG